MGPFLGNAPVNCSLHTWKQTLAMCCFGTVLVWLLHTFWIKNKPRGPCEDLSRMQRKMHVGANTRQEGVLARICRAVIKHTCWIKNKPGRSGTTCILRCIRDKSSQGAPDSPIPGQLCNSVPSASTATRQYPLDAYFHSLLLPARLLVLRLTIRVTCETGQKKLACFASAACMFP